MTVNTLARQFQDAVDRYARKELANNYPELGLDPNYPSESLWELVQEPRQNLPKKHDEEIVSEAAERLKSGQRFAPVESPSDEDYVPFSRMRQAFDREFYRRGLVKEPLVDRFNRAFAEHVPVERYAEFDESKHPRDDEGKFAEKDGSSVQKRFVTPEGESVEVGPDTPFYRAGSPRGKFGMTFFTPSKEYAAEYGQPEEYRIDPRNILDLTQFASDEDVDPEELAEVFQEAGINIDSKYLYQGGGEILQHISQNFNPANLVQKVKEAGYDAIAINEYVYGAMESISFAILDDSAIVG